MKFKEEKNAYIDSDLFSVFSFSKVELYKGDRGQLE